MAMVAPTRRSAITEYTEEELEEAIAEERENARLVGHHVLQAIYYAEKRFDTDYMFEYVKGIVLEIELEYREQLGIVHVRDPNKRRGIGARLRKRIYERDEYRCVTCGTHLDLTIDHIIPVSKGGKNGEENLQTLCNSCNCRKKDRV